MLLLLLLSGLLPSATSFEVLDVGAPRTGTQSMHKAMDILGLRTLTPRFRV